MLIGHRLPQGGLRAASRSTARAFGLGLFHSNAVQPTTTLPCRGNAVRTPPKGWLGGLILTALLWAALNIWVSQ